MQKLGGGAKSPKRSFAEPSLEARKYKVWSAWMRSPVLTTGLPFLDSRDKTLSAAHRGK